MRLVRLPLAHQDPRGAPGCGLVRIRIGPVVEAREQLVDIVLGQVVEVADEERAPALGAQRRSRKAMIPSRVNSSRMCSAGPSTGRPSGWSPNAASSIRCSAIDRGLVVRARDLLHDDAALAVSSSVDPRPADEVRQQVGGLERLVRAGGDVERHQVVAGVGVEDRADPLCRLVDVPVGRVLLAALEHEVLEEVGHPVLVLALGPGTRVERDQDRHRARPVERDPVQRETVVGKRGLLDRGHRETK